MLKRHYKALAVLADEQPHLGARGDPLRWTFEELFEKGLATRVHAPKEERSWEKDGIYWYTITDEGLKIASVKQMELF